MKRISYVLRLVVTVGLLFYVLDKAGFFDTASRKELFILVRSVSIPLLFCSLFVSLLLNFSSAYKWFLLLRSRSVVVSLFRAWSLYMVGIFFSLMLPTSMGGDLIRIHELGKLTGKRAAAAASVFIERFSGMVVLFFLTVIALFLQSDLLSVGWMSVSIVLAVFASALLIWMIIDERPYFFISTILTKRLSFLSGIVKKVDKIHAAVLEYRNDRKALVIALLNSFLFNFLAIVNVYVTALAFSHEVQFLEMLIAVPLIMFIMNLPVSIGGLGLMEFAFVFIFELFGYSGSLALSTAVLMRLKSFVDAGMGGLLYLEIMQNKKEGNSPTSLKKRDG